ncbi:type III secretion protein [Pseudomonas sp. NS1(2017)]|uniref:type III secretion system stator protein SctL n=1 Tax=Pseudomonas sp. NS1(2017) TaxID=2025658 RepID=UPI000BA1EA2C|nr:type III secretion system stator protein SctL [Pseudomonas sp. NS1(2017)]ASV36574.1 type III secretion protein [Pseudomonas sp. NS1(2017)]
MLCRRTIELHKGPAALSLRLIPREELADWEQANQLLIRANTQVEELIQKAEKECEALLEKASLEIWQRADTLLKRWDHDRQAMCESLEHYATSITHQAIRCLLDETVPHHRLAALCKQLLASQVQVADATLLCHPHDLEEMKQCLVNHHVSIWKLHADEAVPHQTLVLKTDEGDFRINWNAMLESFFTNNKEYWLNV